MSSQEKDPQAFQADYQVILMIGDKDPEYISQLGEGLSQDTLIQCIHSENLDNIEQVIQLKTPDLILIFDGEWCEKETLYEFCSQFRRIPQEYRSVLVIQSDATQEERINLLTRGADDVLDTTVEMEELGVRLLVHLRRNLEAITHPVSALPGLPLIGRVFQRRSLSSQSWALIAIEVDYLYEYHEAYGDLATSQVIKTLVSMVQSIVLVPDCIGHTDQDLFLILTTPAKAEKIAAILCRQFENASPNFYSNKDKKQGFMVSISESKVGRRIPLLSLSIGIVDSDIHAGENFVSVCNAAIEMKNLARMTPGSYFQSQCARLAGEISEHSNVSQNIMVVESDAALAYLLKTTLELEGYITEVVSHPDDASRLLNENQYNLVITDALFHGEPSGLNLAKTIREEYEHTRVLCMSTLHDRQKVLDAGVDLYLPKPFELISLFKWIDRLLKGK